MTNQIGANQTGLIHKNPGANMMVSTHPLFRKTAQALAGEYYENKALHNNLFYELFRNQKFFIHKNWKYFIPLARQMLVRMLRGNYPEHEKETIMDALLAERTLR